MNTSPRYEKEDILINFRDMLVHILLRWRSILVGVLLITLLAGGAKYLLDYRSYQKALNASAGETSTLSATQQANVENAYGYHKAYEAAAAYNSTAPLMRIDHTAVPLVTLTFSVKSDHSFNTATQYQPILKDAALYKELVEKEAISYDHNLLPDLVSSTVLHRAETGTAAPAEPVLLCVQVVADSEALCRSIADCLAEKMNGLEGCVLEDQVYSLAVDANIKALQVASLNTANTLRTNYEKAKETLSSQETAALEQRIAGEENDETTQPAKPSVSKKFLVLGFVAGGVLMVLIYGLGYVFGGRVKSPEDMQERYGLSLLGTLPAEGGKTRAIDRWIAGLFRKKSPLSADQALALTIRQIRLAATGDTLLLTGSTLTEEDGTRLQPLVSALEKEGVALTVAPSPLQDASAMDALSKADGVVLVEKQHISTYGDIYRELELCQRLDTPVYGTLLL